MKKNKPKQSSLSSFFAVATTKQNQTLNKENASDRKITATVSSITGMIILSFINTMLDGKSSNITFVSVLFPIYLIQCLMVNPVTLLLFLCCFQSIGIYLS